MENNEKVRVLMVCLGNICRSPMAHGVFQNLVQESGLADRVEVDSAGTAAFHVGKAPDPRAQETARQHRIDIGGQRARQVDAADFEAFDYVLAMDADNHAVLAALCPPGQEGKLRLFLEFAEGMPEREVPDPYYGGGAGFQRAFDLIEAASRGLLEEIRRHRL